MDNENWQDKIEFLESCYSQEVENSKQYKRVVIEKLNEIESRRLSLLQKEHEINMYVASKLVQLFGDKVKPVNVLENQLGSFAVSNEGVFLDGNFQAFQEWVYLDSGGKTKKRNWIRVIILWTILLSSVLTGGSYVGSKLFDFINLNYNPPVIEPRTNWTKENW